MQHQQRKPPKQRLLNIFAVCRTTIGDEFALRARPQTCDMELKHFICLISFEAHTHNYSIELKMNCVDRIGLGVFGKRTVLIGILYILCVNYEYNWGDMCVLRKYYFSLRFTRPPILTTEFFYFESHTIASMRSGRRKENG